MKRFYEAFTLVVKSKNAETGGGVIEIPIFHTSSPEEELAVSLEMMQEMVDNFESFPLVPAGTSPHVDFGQRSGFSPAFIESIRIEGETMFATISLIGPLFHEVAEMGGWRGFSVEASNGIKFQTRTIKGWVLTGGVFTNRGDVKEAHFKVAAEAMHGSELTGTYTVPIRIPAKAGDGDTMTDEKKDGVTIDADATVARSFHEEKIEAEARKSLALEAANQDLTRQLGVSQEETRTVRAEGSKLALTAQNARNDKLAAEAKAASLEVEARGLRKTVDNLNRQVTEKDLELEEQLNVNLAAKVIAVRDAAIGRGVVPALFDGIDADPAAWMTASFASFAAFERHYEALAGVSRDLIKTEAKSGHDVKRGSFEQTNLSADDVTKIKRLGLDPKYVGIKSEGELLNMNIENEGK